LSGTKFRGEFEERIKNLVNEIEEHSNIILFIDEIHTIIGTGSNEGSLDIANILKPALARGKLHCIGATTLAEYRKYFEKDAALSRRFQPIYVDEPSIEDTISILRGLKEKYEIHHGISISDNAIIASAKLSARYITSRKLPDKAIDLIDEAASKRRIELKAKPLTAEKLESKILKNKIEIENLIKENPEGTKRIKTLKEENNNYEKELNKTLTQWNLYKSKIDKLNSYKEALEKNKTLLKTAKRIGDLTLAGKLTHYEIPQIEDFINKLEDSSKEILEDKKVRENDIADIISIWTGVPVNKILENEKKSLINLNSILHERVIGQQKAIEAISSVIKRSRVGINDPKKPIGSFLFLGPTGVGKTEVAKTLAKYLFKNEDELLTFDMSEYTEKHTISKLIGAPPGYIGFENGGRLTKEVKERPFKVILFDEIEKAHPEIFNIFLQILDEGRLMDSEGNYIDFKNTILILTSNIGSEEIIHVKNKEERDKKIEKKINNFFKPEFLNRLDDIIYFNKLDKKDIKLIIKNQLSILQNRLKSKSLKVVFDNQVIDMLIEKGYSDNYGARPLKRIIEKEIGDILADEILYDKIKHNKHLEIKVENGQFKITY
jgi:ATP-dependent Clp protease ATP-binding subunit ClpB